MIALGSCTMKLNAVSEMIPVTWKEFSQPHPFSPVEQMDGYRELFTDLKNWLKIYYRFFRSIITTKCWCSRRVCWLNGNTKFHEKNDEGNRNVCLIPSSAHGTNPASAQMVGMKVVVVKCDEHGNVDFEDLKKKAEEHQR